MQRRIATEVCQVRIGPSVKQRRNVLVHVLDHCLMQRTATAGVKRINRHPVCKESRKPEPISAVYGANQGGGSFLLADIGYLFISWL